MHSNVATIADSDDPIVAMVATSTGLDSMIHLSEISEYIKISASSRSDQHIYVLNDFVMEVRFNQDDTI